ncbi:MAG: YsnF/AvaK domain-containing protein [Acidobacteriota bacterium]|nr:YsnF/AvaK domain-containing protein [Acidobacteriota bacterium]
MQVKTTMTETPVEETVRLREENVTVDRHKVDRAVTDSDLSAVKEGNFTVTEMAEKAVVGKTARVVEEVVVGKDVTEHTETINDTVKRTDVKVDEFDKNNPRR